jgi:hypothetical protein
VIANKTSPEVRDYTSLSLTHRHQGGRGEPAAIVPVGRHGEAPVGAGRGAVW